MSNTSFLANSTYQAVPARTFMLAALLVLWASPGLAAQNSAQFAVSINLLAGGVPQTGFCRSYTGSSAFGATVTYVCSTGTTVDVSPGGAGAPWAPIYGGAYRYVTSVSRAGEPLGTVDSYVGVGTITSWRVVNQADLNYLEMLVHW